jgi:hypothetical protein
MKTRGHPSPDLPRPQIGTSFMLLLISFMLYLDYFVLLSKLGEVEMMIDVYKHPVSAAVSCLPV